MDKEIIKIKQNGKLLAFEEDWQYWLYNGVVYSVRTDGKNSNFWCSVERLNRHLHKLYVLMGYKHFSESKNMVIIDADFFKQFAYA